MRVVILMIFLFSSIGLMASDDHNPQVIYTANAKTSWSQVASENRNYDAFSFRPLNEFVSDLKKWNSHIKTAQLQKGDRIYLRPPHSPYLTYGFEPPLEKEAFFARSFNLIASYSASYAQNRESLSNGTSVDYKLNSPATVGIIARKVFSPEHSLSFSSYLSYTTPGKVNGFEHDTVTPPLEAGGTLYHEIKLLKKSAWNGYYGLDLERFSSLDQEQLNNSKMEFYANHLVYATLGGSIYLDKVFIKASGSYSVYSQSQKDDAFTGYKGILYAGFMAGPRLTYSAFIKAHSLSSSNNDMSGIRLGLGIGYRFY